MVLGIRFLLGSYETLVFSFTNRMQSKHETLVSSIMRKTVRDHTVPPDYDLESGRIQSTAQEIEWLLFKQVLEKIASVAL